MKRMMRTVLVAAALVLPAQAFADEIYLKNEDCHVNAEATYSRLSEYHGYKNVAQTYLKLYKRNPRITAYLAIYMAYESISNAWLQLYAHEYARFKVCNRRKPPVITFTSTSTSVRTMTAGNGMVFTVTQYSTQTHTSTAH
jgi:hypothetical protein